jgi:hypothetical protein
VYLLLVFKKRPPFNRKGSDQHENHGYQSINDFDYCRCVFNKIS